MGADSDEEELAAVRAAKAGGGGPSGVHPGYTRDRDSSEHARLEGLKARQSRLRQEQREHLFVVTNGKKAESGGGEGKPEPAGSMEAPQDDDDNSDGDEDDDDGKMDAPGPAAVEVEDEADIDDGLRAAFPKAFGRQEEKKDSLELRHEATRRKDEAEAGKGVALQGQRGKKKGAKKGGMSFKISSSQGVAGASSVGSVAAETQRGAQAPAPAGRAQSADGGVAGPRQAPSAELGGSRVHRREDEGEGATLGPPRTPSGSTPRGEGDGDEGPVAGPPRPPSDALLRGVDADEGGDEDMVGPRRPSARRTHGGESDEEDEDDGEEDGAEDEDEFRVPISNEVVLQGHTKVVSALAVDPTGARVITGSYDYTVRMYDFGGMDARLKSFRELTPFDGHQVRALTWSPTADLFFVATGNAQAKVYNRDGKAQGEFVRGDMYIRDMRNTSGHLSGLTCADWHPNKRHTVASASEDGSVRIWDVTNFKKQVQVVKPKLARPGRVPVTVCKWGPGGQTISAGLNDGSLQVWNVKSGWGSRPDLFVDAAHERGEDISGLLFSGDGSMLLSRGTDGTLKVWDIRKFKQPVKSFSDLPNHYSQTNIAWSPDERLMLTGTSVEKDGRGSEIVFFNRQELEVVRRTGVSAAESVVRVEWHPRLNQIFASAGNKKAGGTHILYDPTLSERGALQCVARAPRKPRPEDMCASVMPPAIHNPHALPLFREEPSRKRQREKARKDPVLSKRPDLPMEGQGHGGRVGTAKGTLLTQYLLREGGLLKDTWMEEDPREAILRYADVAAKDPQIVAPAYSKTQPKTIFHESDEETED